MAGTRVLGFRLFDLRGGRQGALSQNLTRVRQAEMVDRGDLIGRRDPYLNRSGAVSVSDSFGTGRFCGVVASGGRYAVTCSARGYYREHTERRRAARRRSVSAWTRRGAPAGSGR